MAQRLIGHGEVLRALLHEQAEGRLHHAVILSGPSGIGKATLVFAFALALHSALGDADAADKINAGTHPGVFHVTRSLDDKGRWRGEIVIGDIHRVSHFLAHTASGRGPRIVIIDAADDMNANAANALLKNLEEPPANTHFFLIAHSGARLLPTIRSRCRLIRVQPLSTDEVAEILSNQGFEPGEARAAAEMSNGSVRDAILHARFGGPDLGAALDALCADRTFSPALAQKLAEAVGARDAEPQYNLLVSMLETRLAERARRAAESAAAGAGAMAALHAAIGERRHVAEAYNLDRKLEVALLLRQLHPTLAGS
jgi:DNA polymerase III subunit delta'